MSKSYILSSCRSASNSASFKDSRKRTVDSFVQEARAEMGTVGKRSNIILKYLFCSIDVRITYSESVRAEMRRRT